MGQSAPKKMKNKKRTNTTATPDGKKETKESSKPQNGPSANAKLKVSKSDSECQNVEMEAETHSIQKTKNSNKSKVVLKPEDLGIVYTENLILKQGVKREELLQEKFGMQQLSVLATMGETEKTRAFFGGNVKRDANERVECNGSTPLMLAADNKHVEIVKILLENGADCSLTDHEGNNALMEAVKSGDADIVNLIWPHRNSLNLDHANKSGYTALHYAADRKWECCVQFLLANGASPNCKTIIGETPLMFAAKHGDKKTAERLVQAKADILIEDDRGRTAICLALMGSKKLVLGYLLDKLPVEKSDIFLKSRLYYLKHPFMEDYRDFCYLYLFRLLLRLTGKPAFRDAFYNQKVIAIVLERMREVQLYPQDMLLLAYLLCSIMFMFKKQPDVKLIKQYIYNGGPDFTTDTVRYYKDKMNILVKDSIICYLPIVGITEAPEGIAWLKKHALGVSEYSNCFCGNVQGHLRDAVADAATELDPDFINVLLPAWKTFHRMLFDIQKKQRETTMLKLLQEEEREKERKVRKREKRQQKRQIEKEKKIQKRDVSTDSHNDTVGSSTVVTSTETLEMLVDKHDNENESASRPDGKNRKKKRPKSKDAGRNETENIMTDNSNKSLIESDFVADQMLNFSTHPGSWKTVQTKRQISKDKVKDKLEVVDAEKKDSSTERKCPSKFAKKGNEKWKQQQERFATQPVCWADVAKGVPAPKISETYEESEKKKSDFSYEVEFPTLDGSKEQTEVNESKCDPKDTEQTYNLDNTSDEDLREALTYSAEGSGNPSSLSGFSLNSFPCEVDPCGADEKYYSDDESLAYTQQSLQADATHTGWEGVTNMNTVGCQRTALSMPRYNQEIPMNSETLQYLVDAYIASDTNLEGNIKYSSTESSQDNNALLKSTEKKNQFMSYAAKKSARPKVSTENSGTFLKEESEGIKSSTQGTTEGRTYYEQVDRVRGLEHITRGIQSTGSNIQITQEAYARDPSPTKAPRKRFVPQKNKTALLSKKEQSIQDKSMKERQNYLSVGGIENITTFCYKNTPDIRDQADQQISLSNQDNSQFNSWQVQPDELETTTCIDETDPNSEELPSWYTYTGSSREMLNVSDISSTSSAISNQNIEALSGIQNQFEISVASVDLSKTCAANDDIANDPCVVQYWTKPNISTGEQEFQDQNEACRSNAKVELPKITDNMKELSFCTKEIQRDTSDIRFQMHSQPQSSENAYIYSSENTGHGDTGSVAITETQPHHYNRTSMTQNDIAADRPRTSGIQSQKMTAIVKPISKQWRHARHSVNSALGQSILENAMRIDTTPDEVLYPSDLRGSPEPGEREETGPDYFPSFHEDTRLSSYYQPDAISVFHRLQQIQLTQLKSYFDAFRVHLLNKMSVYQNDFQYYASCTGLTHQQLNQYLGIDPHQQNIEENMYAQQQYTADNTVPTNSVSVSHTDQVQNDRQRHVQQIMPNSQEKPNLTAVTMQAMQRSLDVNSAQPKTYISRDINDIKPSKYNTPTAFEQEEQLNQEAIAAKAARQLADRALQEIKAAYNAMVAHEIKSRRWKEKLLDIRHMPPEDINIIGNIVFPKVNQARYVIASRPETTMLGFLLNGTPVAVRIVNWRSRHLARDELERLIGLDVSKYFMSKYRAFNFSNGNYYIATDLYEYTLDEYLYKLKTDGQDNPLYTNKLIWQFLRGLNSIHQQCLMVHGEIKPGNIVLDVSGNLKIAGYGLGRRVVSHSGSPFSEMSDEDRCWLAPEVLAQEQGDTFKADIWSAGMVMYFILSGGKLPIGADPRDIVWNLSRRNLRMENINEEAFHLLSIMISLNKAERPATSEALRHPYFWAEEKRLRFVLIAGSDVLRDLKAGIPMTGGPGDSMIDILNSVSSTSLSDWMSEIDHAVMKEMRTFRQYKNTVVEVVLFVYNCCLHFEKMSAKAREIIDEPCKYFLTKFPALFMTVYTAIKMSNRTEKTCYKPFF